MCKTKTAGDGTTELYLAWEGTAAKGVLRTVTPSGMVYAQPVRAERHQGKIIVDEPSSTDLAVHAAVVGQHAGKTYMRRGDAWTACEQ